MGKNALVVFWAATAAAIFPVFALAQMGAFAGAQAQNTDISGYSQEMQQSILSYQKGDDLAAMDGFMDILTNGAPGERSMANDYLNLLTRRMDQKARQGAVGNPQTSIVPAPVPLSRSQAQPPTQSQIKRMNRAVMEREIQVKIHSLADKSLEKLRKIEALKIITGPDGNPQAVGVPSGKLFGSGIEFKGGADSILGPLSDLIFALGNAQVQILPEGSSIGDAKIIDMRRAMGISSALLAAGIAPDRVNVNLLNSQVEIPSAIQTFSGIIFVFTYDQPLRLNAGAIGAEDGPPLSLGVDPPSFRADLSEGSIIEFSVEEPPAGIASWEFQLLAENRHGSGGLAPIERVMGDSPVFHQIYWNGHEHYFGPAYSAGRYECVLIATDGKNRRRVIHRWITILPAPESVASVPTPGSTAQSAPSPDWSSHPKAASLIAAQTRLRWVQIKKKLKHKAKRHKAKRRGHKPKIHIIRKKSAAPPYYELAFGQGGYQMDAHSESLMAEIASKAKARSDEAVAIAGYADPSEANADSLARSRAQLIANLLINRYGLDPSRLSISSSVSSGMGGKARVSFAKTK